MPSIHVTIFFIGLFALIQIPLTVMVGFRRVQTNIQFFDGGDQTLLRRMRAHGNYTETVPIVLLAMAAAEVALIPHWALWVGGATLLIGRLIHAATLATIGWGPTRAIGMVLTFVPMAGFGGWCVFQVFQ
ncbi:MAG: MAPEG family protein [Rheinheimera sp.]|nr:MAPEG family protein [Rheinheimera sp.]